MELNKHINNTELTQILNCFLKSAKLIYKKLGNNGSRSKTEVSLRKNFHGETVQKLDVFADELISQNLSNCSLIAGYASEEQDTPVISSKLGSSGKGDPGL